MSEISSEMMPVAAGEFRVGRVLSRSFEVLFQDFGKFVLVGIIAVIPLAFLSLSGGVRSYYGVPTQTFGGLGTGITIAVSLSSLLFYAISQAITLFGAFQDMRGRPFHLGEAFARAFSRFFPLLGLVISWGIAIGLGMVLLIVPGLMLLASFYVSLPACVVEGLGPLQSLSRSAALTKGHRWKVFGIYLLVAAVSLIVGSLIRIIFARVTGPVGGILAGLVWNVLFAAYNSIVITVMYHDLRVLKEGVGIDRIAAVFD